MKENPILNSKVINRNTVSSKSKMIKKQLMDIIWWNKTNKLFLLLTVLASYYVNSESITKSPNLFFVKILENLHEGWYLKKDNSTFKNNDQVNYVLSHLKAYEEVFLVMNDIFDNSGILKKKDSIWKVLEIIKNDFFQYESYRNGTVVHWEWARLHKKFKYISEEKKTYFSNFVFPPHTYIQELIKRLDKKLKDPNIAIYKKAAYIGTYIFMTHPFEDGNSRSSRICMVSYLDRLSKTDFRFFTFISNFTKTLSEDSYIKFLKENVYSEYLKFRDRIKIDENWEILEYISVDEYEKIIEKIADKLYHRIRICSHWFLPVFT